MSSVYGNYFPCMVQIDRPSDLPDGAGEKPAGGWPKYVCISMTFREDGVIHALLQDTYGEFEVREFNGPSSKGQFFISRISQSVEDFIKNECLFWDM
jgi:hypothetical protein